MLRNRQFRLAERPAGRVDERTFALGEADVPVPGEGEALLRTLYLSLDPTNRIWITDMPQYMPPVQIGDVMRGSGVAEVVESRDPKLAPGDLVTGMIGWQDYSLSGSSLAVRKVPRAYPIPTLLNVGGGTGLTAYFGLTDIGQPKPGETVFVSAASGAVGSVAGQIAKILGARVVGITSGAEKCRHLIEDLGFDAAVDRTNPDWCDALAAATPDGIDVDFENAGGAIMEAAMQRMNLFGRVVLCGMIAGYNDSHKALGDFELILMRRLTVRGFIILDYAPRFGEGVRQLMQWVAEGKIKHHETIVDGLENAPAALNRLFDGDKLGKLLIRVTEGR